MIFRKLFLLIPILIIKGCVNNSEFNQNIEELDTVYNEKSTKYQNLDQYGKIIDSIRLNQDRIILITEGDPTICFFSNDDSSCKASTLWILNKNKVTLKSSEYIMPELKHMYGSGFYQLKTDSLEQITIIHNWHTGNKYEKFSLKETYNLKGDSLVMLFKELNLDHKTEYSDSLSWLIEKNYHLANFKTTTITHTKKVGRQLSDKPYKLILDTIYTIDIKPNHLKALNIDVFEN